jgi:signal transduction histidine kinase
MGLPVFYGQKIIGMVGLANKAEGYSEHDVEFLIPFLSTCAHFIEAFRTRKLKREADTELHREIAEKTLLSQRLEVAKEMAEKSAQSKAQFLACMSHEIRTPIHGILGMLDLFSGTSVDIEQGEYLNNMRHCGENLLAIINDVLDFR